MAKACLLSAFIWKWSSIVASHDHPSCLEPEESIHWQKLSLGGCGFPLQSFFVKASVSVNIGASTFLTTQLNQDIDMSQFFTWITSTNGASGEYFVTDRGVDAKVNDGCSDSTIDLSSYGITISQDKTKIAKVTENTEGQNKNIEVCLKAVSTDNQNVQTSAYFKLSLVLCGNEVFYDTATKKPVTNQWNARPHLGAPWVILAGVATEMQLNSITTKVDGDETDLLFEYGKTYSCQPQYSMQDNNSMQLGTVNIYDSVSNKIKTNGNEMYRTMLQVTVKKNQGGEYRSKVFNLAVCNQFTKIWTDANVIVITLKKQSEDETLDITPYFSPFPISSTPKPGCSSVNNFIFTLSCGESLSQSCDQVTVDQAGEFVQLRKTGGSSPSQTYKILATQNLYTTDYDYSSYSETLSVTFKDDCGTLPTNQIAYANPLPAINLIRFIDRQNIFDYHPQKIDDWFEVTVGEECIFKTAEVQQYFETPSEQWVDWSEQQGTITGLDFNSVTRYLTLNDPPDFQNPLQSTFRVKLSLGYASLIASEYLTIVYSFCEKYIYLEKNEILVHHIHVTSTQKVLVSDLRVFFKMTFPECKESLLFSLINLDGSALGSELGLKVKGFSLIQLSTLTSSIRFFLQAENEEQVKAYKQASLIVCGAETVSLQSGFQTIQVSSVNATKMSVSFEQAFVSSDSNCPVFTWGITGSYDSQVFTQNGFYIEINRSTAFELKSLQIEGKTEQEKKATASINFTVCGGEEVSISPSTISTHKFSLGLGNQNVSLSGIFTSSWGNCPAKTFSILDKTTQLSYTGEEISLVEKNLIVKTSKVFSKNITVQAKTSSGRSASLVMSISVDSGTVTQIRVTSVISQVSVVQDSSDYAELSFQSTPSPKESLITSQILMARQISDGKDFDFSQTVEFIPDYATGGVSKIQLINNKDLVDLNFYVILEANNFKKEYFIGSLKVELQSYAPPTFEMALENQEVEVGKELYYFYPVIVNSSPFKTRVSLISAPTFIELIEMDTYQTLEISGHTEEDVGNQTLSVRVWYEDSRTGQVQETIYYQLVTIDEEAEWEENEMEEEEEEAKKKGQDTTEAVQEVNPVLKKEAVAASASAQPLQELTTEQTLVVMITQINNDQLSAQQKEELNENVVQIQEQLKVEILLTSNGISKVSTGGFVFPGVNPQEVEAALKKTKKRSKEIILNQEEEQKTSLRIRGFTTDGFLHLEFNKDMFMPETIDQQVYDMAMVIKIRDKDNKVTKGSFIRQTKEKRMLEEKGDSNPSSFNLTVTEQTLRKIKIKIDFENKKTEGNLEIEITPAGFQLFRIKETGLQLNQEEFTGKLQIQIPSQVSSKLKRALENASEFGQKVIAALSSSNLTVSTLLKASMQQLFGLLRSLQLVVLSMLVRVNLPGHALEFFKICMYIGQLDPFDGEDIYKDMFQFTEVEALNDNYILLGIDSKNFLVNSGSYFIFIALTLVFYIVKFLINRIAMCLARFRLVRIVCIWAESNKFPIGKFLLGLTIEMYFDMFLAVGLQIYAVWENRRSYSIFFVTLGDKINSGMAFTYSSISILLPFVLFFILYRKFKTKSLHESKTKRRYGMLYQDCKTTSIHQVFFNAYFLLRRFIIVFVLVVMDHLPFFQCVIFLLMSELYLLYLICFNPMTDPRENLMNIINEFILWMSCVMMLLFLNEGYEEHMLNMLGWFEIGIVSLLIFINLVSVGQVTVANIWSIINDFFQKRRIRMFNKQTRDRRLKLIEESKGQATELQEMHDYFEAINFCSDWLPHRKWLKENGLDLNKFEEEVTYQRYRKRFNLEEELKMSRLGRALTLALSTQARKRLGSQIVAEKRDIWWEKMQQQFGEDIPKPQQNLVELKTKIDTPFSKKLQQAQQQLKLRQTFGKKYNNSLNQTKMPEIEEQDEDIIQPTPKYRHAFNGVLDDLNQNKLLAGFKNGPEFFKGIQDELDTIEKEIKGNDPNIGQFIGNTKESLTNMRVGVKSQEQVALFNDLLPIGGLEDSSDEDIEDYGNEVHELLYRTDEQILEDSRHEDGFSVMINGGEMNVMSAVLQCMIPVERVVNFMLKQEFTGQLCSLVREAFQSNFRKRIKVLDKYQRLVDLAKIRNFFQESMPETEIVEANIFFQEFMRMIYDELVFVPQGLSTFNFCFGLYLNRFKRCESHHIDVKQIRPFALEIPKTSSVRSGLKKVFEEAKLEKPCPQCSKLESQNKLCILSLPQYICLDLNKNRRRHIKLNKMISFKEFIQADMMEANRLSTYVLVGLVTDSKHNSDSIYEAVVLRQVRSKAVEYWVRINQGKGVGVTEEEVLQTRAVLLFYKKLDRNEKIAAESSSEELKSESSEAESESESESSSSSSEESEGKEEGKEEGEEESSNASEGKEEGKEESSKASQQINQPIKEEVYHQEQMIEIKVEKQETQDQEESEEESKTWKIEKNEVKQNPQSTFEKTDVRYLWEDHF